jgi:hypothetical protein
MGAGRIAAGGSHLRRCAIDRSIERFARVRHACASICSIATRVSLASTGAPCVADHRGIRFLPTNWSATCMTCPLVPAFAFCDSNCGGHREST